MQTAIELHDSVIEGIRAEGSTLSLLFSTLVIHESTGMPGTDAGTYWMQKGSLTLISLSSLPSLRFPFSIFDGTVSLNGNTFANVIPIPIDSGTQFQCALKGYDSDDTWSEMCIQGTFSDLVIEGEKRHEARFPNK